MDTVLILGSGGREHAIADWFNRHGKLVYTAPGNAGTAMCGTNLRCNDFGDLDELVHLIKMNRVDLVVPGPEAPLVAGLRDVAEKSGVSRSGTYIFGPPQRAAMLEGSKSEARRFGRNHGVKQPRFVVFDENDLEKNLSLAETLLADDGLSCLRVVKADGLCGGKGVTVCDSREEVIDAIKALERFGDAGRDFLLEERLRGPEASLTAIVNSNSRQGYILLPSSTDHKPRFDGDKGPMTGGMGAYSPSAVITPDIERRIVEDIIEPTIAGLWAEQMDYHGFLYFSVMVQDGQPYLIEYNVRFGDPEAQAVIPLVMNDPFELMMKCRSGEMRKEDIMIRDGAACCVVLVDERYPGKKPKDEEDAIVTIDPMLLDSGHLSFFHAATRRADGVVRTPGGRVGGLTARGQDHRAAIENAYLGIRHVKFDRLAYRNDIGYTALRR